MISTALSERLHGMNPWWTGRPSPPTPTYRRWLYQRLKRSLLSGPAPITALRGPRRVGKSTLVRQLAAELLASGVAPTRIFYLSFDELPSLRGVLEGILTLALWFEKELLVGSFNGLAQAGTPVYLLLDEVQNLDDWAPQIKHLSDIYSVRLLITGSSSLRIEAGRDSLAGRISTLELGPLRLRELAQWRQGAAGATAWRESWVHDLAQPDYWRSVVAEGEADREARLAAFDAFSARGAFPVAHDTPDLPWPELAAFLEETVVQRAIQHDLRMGPRGQRRDAQLLAEVLRLACRYAGQAPGWPVLLDELRAALGHEVGVQRLQNYLSFLDGTLLLRQVRSLELRLKRRAAPPKLCLCDPTLRACWLGEVVPLAPNALATQPHLADLAGRLAESVVGYFLDAIPGMTLHYFPPRPGEPEVDFVMTIGTHRIPVEIKYRRRVDPRADTEGLRSFLDRPVYQAPFGLLVTQDDSVTLNDPRIIPISLSSLLWMR